MASPALAPTKERDGLWKRYREAYTVATDIIRFGKSVQEIAVLIGSIILFISVMTALHDNSPKVLGIGVLVAVVSAGGCWTLGMVIMAQGQIIRVVVDSAVNTCPLLDDESKARFLGLHDKEHSCPTLSPTLMDFLSR